jgi:hypothetical protein
MTVCADRLRYCRREAELVNTPLRTNAASLQLTKRTAAEITFLKGDKMAKTKAEKELKNLKRPAIVLMVV